MFVVDTNVLVYSANDQSPFHPRCSELVNLWRAQAAAWFVTWGILYEFLRITTHPRVLAKPWKASRAWDFVESLLASPGLGVLVETDRHSAVAAAVLKENLHVAGNLMHDAHTAVLMREHGIHRVYTRDTGFHRFSFLETVDPVA